MEKNQGGAEEVLSPEWLSDKNRWRCATVWRRRTRTSVDELVPPSLHNQTPKTRRGPSAAYGAPPCKITTSQSLTGQPTRLAIQRLGLCRVGFSPRPEPPPAKRQDFVLARAIRFASDVAACTSRAATSFPKTLRALRYPTGHLGPPDRSTDATHAGRQRHCGFSLRPASLCSAAKPQRLCLCLWRSDRAPMSPLRAVGSRGHIGQETEVHGSRHRQNQSRSKGALGEDQGREKEVDPAGKRSSSVHRICSTDGAHPFGSMPAIPFRRSFIDSDFAASAFSANHKGGGAVTLRSVSTRKFSGDIGLQPYS